MPSDDTQATPCPKCPATYPTPYTLNPKPWTLDPCRHGSGPGRSSGSGGEGAPGSFREPPGQDHGAGRDAAPAAAQEHHGFRAPPGPGARAGQVHLHPQHHPGAGCGLEWPSHGAGGDPRVAVCDSAPCLVAARAVNAAAGVASHQSAQAVRRADGQVVVLLPSMDVNSLAQAWPRRHRCYVHIYVGAQLAWPQPARPLVRWPPHQLAVSGPVSRLACTGKARTTGQAFARQTLQGQAQQSPPRSRGKG